MRSWRKDEKWKKGAVTKLLKECFDPHAEWTWEEVGPYWHTVYWMQQWVQAWERQVEEAQDEAAYQQLQRVTARYRGGAGVEAVPAPEDPVLRVGNTVYFTGHNQIADPPFQYGMSVLQQVQHAQGEAGYTLTPEERQTLIDHNALIRPGDPDY